MIVVPRRQPLKCVKPTQAWAVQLRTLHTGRGCHNIETGPHQVDNINSSTFPSLPTHSTDSPPILDKCYEIARTRNRGLATFATKAIPAFSRIISDIPVVTMSQGDDLPQLWENYTSLSERMKQRYDHLHRPHQPERTARLVQKLIDRGNSLEVSNAMAGVASVFQTNAFKVDGGSTGADSNGKSIQRALFLNIARLNHSCAPTAHTSYNPRTNRMTVHTLRDIDPNTEIVISYFNMLLPVAERQVKAGSWGFVCRCPACDMGPGHSRHEDARSRLRETQAQHLRLVRGEVTEVDEIMQTVDEVDTMADIIRNETSLMPQLPFAYEYSAVSRMVAFEATRDKTLLDRIMEMLKRSVAAEIAITGADSPSTERRREKVGAYEHAIASISG